MLVSARLRLAAVLVFIPFMLCMQAAAAEEAGAARKVIEDFYGILQKSMTEGDKLGFNGRYELIMPAFAKAYDMDRMARRALGPEWRSMNKDDVKRMQETFTRMNVSTYAARFKRPGTKFAVGEATVTPNVGVVVESQIIPAKGDPVPINYLLTQETGEWKINDVFLKGTISELAVRRADFAQTLKQGGIDALIKSMEGKIAELESEQ